MAGGHTVRGRRARVGAVAAVVLLTTGCGSTLGLPEPASDDADQVLGLWRGSVLAGLAVASLIWALVVWSVLRYRRRNDDLPSQIPENIPIEIAYTVAPLVVVAVLFGVTVVTQERVTGLEARPDLEVEVVGFQWSWEFRYRGEDVTVATDGDDDPELVLPVGSLVRFDLHTVDVNHSFWVPEFLVKRDLIARVDNRLDVEVTRAGTWVGRCAEFCGLKHWAMRFGVRAVPPAEFERWLADQRRTAA